MTNEEIMERYKDISRDIDIKSYSTLAHDEAKCAAESIGFNPYLKDLIDDEPFNQTYELFNQIKDYEDKRFVKLCEKGFFDNLLQARHFKKYVQKILKKAYKYAVKYAKNQAKIKDYVRQESNNNIT